MKLFNLTAFVNLTSLIIAFVDIIIFDIYRTFIIVKKIILVLELLLINNPKIIHYLSNQYISRLKKHNNLYKIIIILIIFC